MKMHSKNATYRIWRSKIYNNITKDEQAEMKISVVRFIGCTLI